MSGANRRIDEAAYLRARYSPIPDEFADRIIVSVEAHPSWLERMLLLFRPLLVEVMIDCEHEPGRVVSMSHVMAARWVWPWAGRGAYAGSPSLPKEST